MLSGPKTVQSCLCEDWWCSAGAVGTASILATGNGFADLQTSRWQREDAPDRGEAIRLLAGADLIGSVAAE